MDGNNSDLISIESEKLENKVIIEIDNMNKFHTSETPLICFDIEFKEEISYKKYNFIPVGTQCVLLNNDIMLVGLWGKILIAYRVK